MHFTCILVNLSRFKMIITSDCIEDKYSRKAESAGLDTSSIPVDISRFNKARYLSICQATRFLI